MYRFSRMVRLSGSHLQAAMALAVEITDHVRSVTGQPLNLYTEAFSSAPGTLAWTTTAADLTTIEGSMDKLMADTHYNGLAESAQQYILPGTLTDKLRSVVYPTEALGSDGRLPEYVTAVYSTIAGGQLANAMSVGVAIAKKTTEITGLVTEFEVDATGNFGGVAWLTACPTVNDMQRGEEKLYADPSFLELVDKKGATAFAATPGATWQRVLRRIA